MVGPCRAEGTAGDEPPTEPLRSRLIVGISGKRRKGLRDPMDLDVLAASRKEGMLVAGHMA